MSLKSENLGMTTFSFMSEMFFIIALCGNLLAYSSLKLGVYDEDEQILCFRGISSPSTIFYMMLMGLFYIIFTIGKIVFHIFGNTWPIPSFKSKKMKDENSFRKNSFFRKFMVLVFIGVMVIIGFTFDNVRRYFNNAKERIQEEAQKRDKDELEKVYNDGNLTFDEIWKEFEENVNKTYCYVNSDEEMICDNCTKIDKKNKESLTSWVLALTFTLCICHAYNTIWNTFYNVPSDVSCS